jgi:hypothetical protein
MFSTINAACIQRERSIKIKDSFDNLTRYWSLINNNDVYKAMLKMTNIEFVVDVDEKQRLRGVPFLCGDEGSGSSIYGDKEVYPTAIDFFRRLTRRFIINKIDSGLNYGKIMRMWSDFIDFSKVPAHLIWDIDELYRQLYESERRRYYQDQYLYFGSSVVLDEGQPQERWASDML